MCRSAAQKAQSGSRPKSHPRRGACGIHATVIHRRKARLSHFRVNCNCWACPHCVETILRQRLLRHLTKIATDAGKLFHSTCRDAEWASFYNRQLRGLRYFWVRSGNIRHVFTNKPLKGGERSASGSLHLSGKTLLATVAKFVREIPYDSCPFDCCRPWSMKCRTSPKDCELVALSVVRIRDMQLSAESLGIKTSTSFTELGEVLNLRASREQAASIIALARQIARTERIERQRREASVMPRPAAGIQSGSANYPYTRNPRGYDSSLSAGRPAVESPHPLVV